MNLLLVGGSGLVGTFVTPYLQHQHTLRVLDIHPPKHDDIEYVCGSITDPEKGSFFGMVRSKKAKDLRHWIKKTKCRCTYECAMSTNTLFSWPLAGRLYGRLAKSLITANPGPGPASPGASRSRKTRCPAASP